MTNEQWNMLCPVVGGSQIWAKVGGRIYTRPSLEALEDAGWLVIPDPPKPRWTVKDNGYGYLHIHDKLLSRPEFRTSNEVHQRALQAAVDIMNEESE